ncbi:MAG TPA: type II secretion system F family protein [Gaiellaceae bacterium]|jgi:type IV pilus assembly protein PilC
MAEFTYDAINAQGMSLTGVLSAPDVAAAREQLQAKGLLPKSLTEQAAAGETSAGSAFKKIKPKSLQVFARQLATMIEAGVSVVAALVTLEEQTDDKYLKQIVAEVRGDVETGTILSKALARHPRVFNRLFVAMVAAGEQSGTLDTVLDRVASQIEAETKLKRRVKGAMVYPAVVMTFATLVLIFMLLFIVPVFQNVFDSLGGQLPTPTKIVIAASHTLRNYWFIIFPVVGFAIWSLRRWMRTEQGRQLWDRFRLRVPMKIGDVVQKVALARLSRTLATLVAAGVDILTALEIAAGTAGNWVIEQSLRHTAERVHEGVPISGPLADDPVFPPMVSQMVRIGEETGELDKMLGKIADFYEDEVDASIQSLTSIIEPVLMIGVGAMVGTIVISMYLPMFKLLTLIK